MLHRSYVTHTPEFLNRMNTRAHGDILHVLHDIYTIEDVSHMCHTYTAYIS